MQFPKPRNIALAGILGSVSGLCFRHLRDDTKYRKQFILCTASAGAAGAVFGYVGARINKLPHKSVTSLGNGMNGVVMSALFLSMRKFFLEGHPKLTKLKEYMETSFHTDINPPTIHPVPAAVASGSLTGAIYSLFVWTSVANLGVNVLLGVALGFGAHYAYQGFHILFLELAIRHHHPEVVNFPESVKKETWDEWIVRMAAKKTSSGELKAKIMELELEYLNLQEKEDELLRNHKQLVHSDQVESSPGNSEAV